MGCDIHLHVEVKIKGRWHHYDQPRINRSYFLFNVMAGVRNEGQIETPISSPRGLPIDATEIVAIDSEEWGSDGHSHSYIVGKEVVVLFKILRERLPEDKRWSLEWDEWGYLFGNSYDGFYKYPQDYPNKLEDIRFVFWFDN